MSNSVKIIFSQRDHTSCQQPGFVRMKLYKESQNEITLIIVIIIYTMHWWFGNY